MPKMKFVIATALCILHMWGCRAQPVTAHELPDGQVERAIQVVVFPDQIQVQYWFGMSPATMRELLTRNGETPSGNDDARVQAQVLESVAPQIAARLLLRLNDRLVAPLRSEPSLIHQHHLQFACDFSYPRETGGLRLLLEDENWSDWPGYFRTAIKAREGTELQDANAPLVIIRAERTAVQTAADRRQLPMIEATVDGGPPPAPAATEPAGVPATEKAAVAETVQKSPAAVPPVRTLPLWLIVLLVAVVALLTVPLLVAQKR